MFFAQRRAQKAARKQAENQRQQAIAKKKEKAQKIQELTSLLDRAEKGDIGAQNQLVNQKWYSTNPSRKKRIAANALRVEVRKENDYYGKQLRRSHADWLEARGTDQEIEILASLLSYYKCIRTEENLSRIHLEFGITRDEVARQLQVLVTTRHEELLSQSGDFQKFEELWDFIRLTRDKGFHNTRGEYLYGGELLHGVDPLPYPDNWNDLVASHYDTPALNSFRGLPDRGTGDVRLLAADALRSDDFTQAQIALAYCNSVKGYRAAVGDVLTAELAKLVMRHRAETADVADEAKLSTE